VIHVVDTHALLRYFEDLNLLGAQGRGIMTDRNSDLLVPTIVLAEARWTIRKQRANVDWDDLIRSIESDGRFTVAPLTLDIVRRAPDELEMNDAIICATVLLVRDSLGEEVPLITRDRRIRDSGLVDTVW
jgi:PIN domain nuclease of toxin-antitoxin system